MRGNNILGIIFAYVNGERIPEFTKNRMTASVPFGGRYRFIDFPLSNMVNSGINKVGVITDYHYQSLMDHVGSGKAWDLSRKREGLFLLPPFGAEHSRNDGKISSLYSIKRFLESSLEDYVLLSDSDLIYNMNYKDALLYHIEKDADITMIYRKGNTEENINTNVIEIDENGKVFNLKIIENAIEDVNMGMNLYIVKRKFLIKAIDECMACNVLHFDRGLLFNALHEVKMYAYEFKGTCFQITSKESYFKANMALMDKDVRDEMFNPKYPIYTKVKDEMPAKYGLDAKVVNSLVADGCVIDGEVENCILFRGAKVKKGAKVKNCVIMQNATVGENAIVENIITDKNVVITDNTELKGSSKYHAYIKKDSIV